MEIIDEIKKIIDSLDDVQEYIDNLNNQLSVADSKIMDILHLIEKETLKTNQCYRAVKELKKCRLERRNIKNNMELAKTLNINLNKLLNSDNRKFLLAELYKTNNKLNQPYKYRIYTEEEIKELIGV